MYIATILLLKSALILWGIFMAASVAVALAKYFVSGSRGCLNSNCKL